MHGLSSQVAVEPRVVSTCIAGHVALVRWLRDSSSSVTEHRGHFSDVFCRAETRTIVCAASSMTQTPQHVPQQNFVVKAILRPIARRNSPRVMFLVDTGPYGLHEIKDVTLKVQ